MLRRLGQARLEKGFLYSCELTAYEDIGELGSTSTAEVLPASPWMTRGSHTHDRSEIMTMTGLSRCHDWTAINGGSVDHGVTGTRAHKKFWSR